MSVILAMPADVFVVRNFERGIGIEEVVDSRVTERRQGVSLEIQD